LDEEKLTHQHNTTKNCLENYHLTYYISVYNNNIRITTMELLTNYLALQKELFDYFGYVEDWRVIPIEDSRDEYWHLTDSETTGAVRFHEDKDTLLHSDGNYYENEIYTQRHLHKWVYRGKDYTMICVDTHTDGNQFLQIFSNDKEVTEW
jgi:hypothetical protein